MLRNERITGVRYKLTAHCQANLKLAHLAKHRYNQRSTAKALGLTYDQLRHCMKKHGLGERVGG